MLQLRVRDDRADDQLAVVQGDAASLRRCTAAARRPSCATVLVTVHCRRCPKGVIRPNPNFVTITRHPHDMLLGLSWQYRAEGNHHVVFAPATPGRLYSPPCFLCSVCAGVSNFDELAFPFRPQGYCHAIMVYRRRPPSPFLLPVPLSWCLLSFPPLAGFVSCVICC